MAIIIQQQELKKPSLQSSHAFESHFNWFSELCLGCLETTRPFQKLEKADLFNKIFLIIQKLIIFKYKLGYKMF